MTEEIELTADVFLDGEGDIFIRTGIDENGHWVGRWAGNPDHPVVLDPTSPFIHAVGITHVCQTGNETAKHVLRAVPIEEANEDA